MNAFYDHLYNLRDQALEDAGRARDDLTHALDEYQESKFAWAMGQATYAQRYARWWMAVTDEIEHGGLDSMAALTKVRTAARQALLQNRITWGGSCFDVAYSYTVTEATHRFYNDTAQFNLDAITGTGPAAPIIAGSPGTASPSPGATPTHQATSPIGQPARPYTGPDTSPTRDQR